jgi:hypothetical protein
MTSGPGSGDVVRNLSRVFDDVHLVNDNGRATATFTLEQGPREALADALSWHLTNRFQAPELDTETVLELRAAGALADRLDKHRGEEGRAPVRVDSTQARALIEAAWAYIAERDTESYQPPEGRARLERLFTLVDPLFDLISDLERADKVLRGSSMY